MLWEYTFVICSLHSLSVQTQVGALIEVGLLEDCFAFCRVFSMLSLFESSIWPQFRGAQEVLPGFLVANMQVYPFQGFLAMPIM